ncbi:2-isopropylmalate synthase [Actinobaculum suis]|uniref:2-isopropylmalate synthase n=1 Tax=Actinobaculum suis TaxID=1657 RepID=UPI00080880CB|nr:2-isopropylmalate synthase [Actinobaculum suis]OCA93812.1 2-isopropylmalate synthase [Actinobaculum suis]OCA94105.1 2-isopropylmalate synthase [Actinobaculum suis]
MKTSGFANRQQPSGMPYQKYRPFLETNPVSLPDRLWPNNRITKAPRWLSTDLRDGNQALPDPMSISKKRAMFDQLVKMGFKEIEIGFPAASETEWEFVRSLAETDAVPEDVTVSVLTQSRPELIQRTIDSLAGFPRATVHIYNATSPVFRRVVFGTDRAGIKNLAIRGTQEVMSYIEKVGNTDTVWGLEYSPEIFVDTELDYALEVCEAVMDVWQPDAEREIILNLPTTVERATPNVYADQIEWMSRNLSRREYICLSAHNHNDRGTGVATTELAMLAGADRIEGCLFGQGERTGNVDLVNVAMNLYTQGIDPQLDFSDIDEVVRVSEYCNQMDVPPRTPYAGALVYTSFSGSHQDAIKKGMDDRQARLEAAGGDELAVPWDLPYLPLDPKDVGRTYDAIVRVNSQSGKGGVAYILKSTRHMDLPRRMQMELSRIIKHYTDTVGHEISAEKIWDIFKDEYLPADSQGKRWGKYRLREMEFGNKRGGTSFLTAVLEKQADGTEITVDSEGNGPIDAFVKGLGRIGEDVHVLDYQEHALGEGGDATAAAYVECEVNGQVLWGCGIHTSTTRAALKAIISAVNRAHRS